jgi:hypothetical protein
MAVKEIEAKKMDEEVEETLVAPKIATAIDGPDDRFSVTVDTANDITVYVDNEDGYTLPVEEVERLVSKLTWALEAQSALSSRVPF